MKLKWWPQILLKLSFRELSDSKLCGRHTLDNVVITCDCPYKICTEGLKNICIPLQRIANEQKILFARNPS